MEKSEQKNQGTLPFRIFFGTIPYVAGFYVGLRDGKGIPINPMTKYTLLATPTISSGAFTGIGSYVISKLGKKMLQPKEKPILEETLNSISENKREQGLKEIKIIAYDVPSEIPEAVAKSAGKTALKTGIGYVAGNLFSTLI